MRTYSWINPKLEVRETKRTGKGVFATEIIKKDELIAISGGYIFTVAEFKQLPNDVKYFTFQVEENFFMCIKTMAEVEDNWLFNHSCAPNVGPQGQISLVAMRTISGGGKNVPLIMQLYFAGREDRSNGG